MKKIMQISDLHFGWPYRDHVGEQVLKEIKKHKPDLLIVSGDITQRARVREFKQAQEFFNKIKCKKLIVIGNHDIPPHYRPFLRIFSNYSRFKKYINPNLEDKYEDEDMLVYGINTVFRATIKGGHVHRDSMHWLEEELKKAKNDKRFKIVVSHHRAWPKPKHIFEQNIVLNAKKLVELLDKYNVNMLLSGHEHYFELTDGKEHYPLKNDIIFIKAGTATSKRGLNKERRMNSYVAYEVHKNKVQVLHQVFDNGSFKTKSTTTIKR